MCPATAHVKLALREACLYINTHIHSTHTHTHTHTHTPPHASCPPKTNAHTTRPPQTLIHYDVEAWEGRAYEYGVEALGQLGVPVEGLRFDSSLVIRG